MFIMKNFVSFLIGYNCFRYQVILIAILYDNLVKHVLPLSIFKSFFIGNNFFRILINFLIYSDFTCSLLHYLKGRTKFQTYLSGRLKFCDVMECVIKNKCDRLGYTVCNILILNNWNLYKNTQYI